MFSLYRDTHAPTGVDMSVSCELLQSGRTSLCVCMHNTLTVYDVEASASQSSAASQAQNEAQQTSSLVEVLKDSMCGVPVAMSFCRLRGAQTDTLVLAFEDAKISMVEYDPVHHRLHTIYLQSFEHLAPHASLHLETKPTQASASATSTTPHPAAPSTAHNTSSSTHPSLVSIPDVRGCSIVPAPLMRVDAQSKCIALICYGTKLVLIPLQTSSQAGKEGDSAASDQLHHMLQHRTRLKFMTQVIDLNNMDMDDPHGYSKSTSASLSKPVVDVADLCWLDGYTTPTLMLLHDTKLTWQGRFSLFQDTKAVSVFTVEITAEGTVKTPIPQLWYQDNLPSLSHTLVPMAPPLGGCIVLAVNTLVYVDQGETYAVAVNNMAIKSTRMRAHMSQDLTSAIVLDGSHWTPLGRNRTLLSLRDGQLFVISPVVEGRSLLGIRLTRVARGVIPSTLASLDNQYIFLGSRLGSSLLLRYVQTETSSATAPARPRRTSTSATTAMDQADADLYEQESGEAESNQALLGMSLSVCDSLPNIAPCREAAVGQHPVTDEFVTESQHQMDLVCCSGHGKNGAVSVIHQTVRPQVFLSTDALMGCQDVFTVCDAHKADVHQGHDAYVVLSRHNGSLVLTAGENLQELPPCGFATDQPTVLAGNMIENQYIIQVTLTSIVLLKGAERVQEVELETESDIKHASLVDPYLMLVFEDRSAVVYELDPSVPSLQPIKADFDIGTCAATLYRDTSGILSKDAFNIHVGDEPAPRGATKPSVEEQRQHPEGQQIPDAGVKATHIVDPADEEDDEDYLLYGVEKADQAPVPEQPDFKESDATSSKADQDVSMTDAENIPTVSDQTTTSREPTYWAFCATDNGSLHIYEVPSLERVFVCEQLGTLPDLLENIGVDMMTSTAAESSDAFHAAKTSERSALPEELSVVPMYDGSGPHLVVRMHNHLLCVYKILPALVNMPARLSKHLQVPLWSPTDGDVSLSIQTKRWLRPYKSVGGCAGVFVCGTRPVWLMAGHRRKALHAHRMPIDGTVKAFAPFTNTSCPEGFIFFNDEGVMRICTLPMGFSYDEHVIARRVPLKKTACKIVYHAGCQVYVLVTNSTIPAPYPALRGNEYIPDNPTILKWQDMDVPPQEDQFAIHLFSPLTWNIVPERSVNLSIYEHITSMTIVKLKSLQHVSGFKDFLAVGITSVAGDEMTAMGRIEIYDVLDVVPEAGQPETKNKLKRLASLKQRGAVTAISSNSGYLLGCVGQRDGEKIFVWEFQDMEVLRPIAFCEAMVFSNVANTMKNFTIIGDVNNSVQLLRLTVEEEQHRKNNRAKKPKLSAALTRIGRDLSPANTLAAEFLVKEDQFRIVVTDEKCNLAVLEYAPLEPDTEGGRVLSRRSVLNTRLRIQSLTRFQCAPYCPHPGAPPEPSNRHFVHIASLEGSLAYITPIAEMAFRRLSMLQAVMQPALPQLAGLNPKEYRYYRGQAWDSSAKLQPVLDGTLLWRFFSLPLNEQMDIAGRVGLKPSQVFQDLLEANDSADFL